MEGEHVPAAVAWPRWLCWCAEWMAHTLIALHTKFQMQRTCICGDRSETEPSRPLLRAKALGVFQSIATALPALVGVRGPSCGLFGHFRQCMAIVPNYKSLQNGTLTTWATCTKRSRWNVFRFQPAFCMVMSPSVSLAGIGLVAGNSWHRHHRRARTCPTSVARSPSFEAYARRWSPVCLLHGLSV